MPWGYRKIIQKVLFAVVWFAKKGLVYNGDCTCTSLLANTSALFTVCLLPPPPRASTKMNAPLLAVPLYCRALDTFIPPCTVLLFIFTLYDIELRTRARDPRATHYFSASSWRSKTRPPFGHDRSCLIEKFLPKPSQVAGMYWGIRPYIGWRLSHNLSRDNYVPLKRWGIALSHAPFLIYIWRRLLSWPPAISICIVSSAIYTCFRSFLSPTIAPRTHALWTT